MDKEFITERYANIRNAHNISARKLSVELGQSTEYINQIENGRKMPSLDGLFNFCDYFSLTLAEFFDEAHRYPVQYKKLLSELNKLSPDELEHVIKTIQLIAVNKS